jgi:hypothetical protein
MMVSGSIPHLEVRLLKEFSGIDRRVSTDFPHPFTPSLIGMEGQGVRVSRAVWVRAFLAMPFGYTLVYSAALPGSA